MLERFKHIIDTEFDSLANKRIYLAISGGKDSMVLCDLLQKINCEPILLHCNFKLRGEESEKDEVFLIEYAKSHNLQLFVKRFDTKKEAEQRNLTIQETARELRYQWFDGFLNTDKDVLLTAHHLDDSIETFFINLLRGTGIKGLVGINAKGKQLHRPLHSFYVKEIEEYITVNKIAFRQDLSNFNSAYLRNDLRNNLIPQLENKTSNFKEKVAKTMLSLNEINDWMNKKAIEFRSNHFKNNKGISEVSTAILKKEDPVFLAFILKEYSIHRSTLESFIAFLNSSSGSIFETEKYTIYMDREKVFFNANDSSFDPIQIQIIDFPHPLEYAQQSIHFDTSTKILPHTSNIQQLDVQNVNLPLTVRNWKTADRINPLGMSGTKLVSDILIDKKIPQVYKPSILIVEDSSSTIICIIGLVISEQFKVTEDTQQVLVITNQN